MSEKILINSIAWVRSLPVGDLGSTRRILEDLRALEGANGFKVLEFEVSTREDFFDLMARLRDEANSGLRPILHIDAHGSEKKGLFLSPSGESVTWRELVDRLRCLNVATENSLVCVLALCFGLHGIKDFSLTEAVPAYLLCASGKEVNTGFLERETTSFYKNSIETGDIIHAFEKTLGSKMSSVHCQSLFLKILLKYVRENCPSKVRQEWLEQMVTRVRNLQGNSRADSDELKKLRRHIRTGLKPGQHIIDKYAPTFLIGRKPLFNYSDIQRILDKDYMVRPA